MAVDPERTWTVSYSHGHTLLYHLQQNKIAHLLADAPGKLDAPAT